MDINENEANELLSNRFQDLLRDNLIGCRCTYTHTNVTRNCQICLFIKQDPVREEVLCLLIRLSFKPKKKKIQYVPLMIPIVRLRCDQIKIFK